MASIINFWYTENTYKSAKCKCCSDKLIQGSKILSVVRTQGSFNSTGNYCNKCAEAELANIMEEISKLMKNAILIQEAIDNEKSLDKKVEECFTEACQKFGSTLQKLAEN